MTQGELAQLAGIPRQQVVRAERGDNITLETLRSIVAHLPVTQLTLMENVQLVADLLPQPAKIHFQAMEMVGKMNDALRSALSLALSTRMAMQDALDREPLRVAAGLEKTSDDDIGLLRQMDAWVQGLGKVRDQIMGPAEIWSSALKDPKVDSEDRKPGSEDRKRGSEDPKPGSEDPKLDSDDPKLDSEDRKLDSEDRKLGSEDRKLDSEDPKLDPEDRKLGSEDPKLDPEDSKTDS